MLMNLQPYIHARTAYNVWSIMEWIRQAGGDLLNCGSYLCLALALDAGCFCCLLFCFKNCLLLVLGMLRNFCHCCLFLSLVTSSGVRSRPLPRPLTWPPTPSAPWVCHLPPEHSVPTHAHAVTGCSLPRVYSTHIMVAIQTYVHTRNLYISVTTFYVQQNCSWATHVAIIRNGNAGRFDLKVFVNCRVQVESNRIIAVCCLGAILLFI